MKSFRRRMLHLVQVVLQLCLAVDELPAEAIGKRQCAVSAPTVVHACGFAAEYGGNFVDSLSQLRETCRGRDLDFVAVFPESARERPWCVKLAAEHWRIRFLPDGASTVRCAWSIAGIISRENAQLIHTHFTDFDAAAWLGAKVAGLLGSRPVPVVWHMHSEFRAGDTVVRRLKDLIRFRCMGGSAHIILANDHLKERPLAAGFGRERLHVIPTGLDFARMDGTRSLVDPFTGLGVKKDAAVLMNGWAPAVKGVDVALAAFEIVARTRSDLTLLIVSRKQTRDEVRRLYPEGNPPWLRLIPAVDNNADYFRGAGIFLSASRREGFPYSVLEASASRCLLVSSDIPALRWIKESVRFWWFRSEDSIDLAGRIIECAALREDERREIVRVNSEFIREHRPVKKWAVEVAEAYGRIRTC